jgi:hypothetical protein
MVPLRSPEMTKDAIPSGMDLLLGGSFVTTPVTAVLWVNHPHHVIVRTTSGSLSFQKWLDGASQVITIEESSKVPHMPLQCQLLFG